MLFLPFGDEFKKIQIGLANLVALVYSGLLNLLRSNPQEKVSQLPRVTGWSVVPTWVVVTVLNPRNSRSARL